MTTPRGTVCVVCVSLVLDPGSEHHPGEGTEGPPTRVVFLSRLSVTSDRVSRDKDYGRERMEVVSSIFQFVDERSGGNEGPFLYTVLRSVAQNSYLSSSVDPSKPLYKRNMKHVWS